MSLSFYITKKNNTPLAKLHHIFLQIARFSSKDLANHLAFQFQGPEMAEKAFHSIKNPFTPGGLGHFEWNYHFICCSRSIKSPLI